MTASASRLTATNSSRSALLAHLIVVLVIAGELAYLAYFFSLDLPNADLPDRPGKKISRRMIWEWAVPGLVPDEPCLARQVLTELKDWRHLGQRVPIACCALLIVTAGVSVGAGLLRLLGLGRPGASPPTAGSNDHGVSVAATLPEWLVLAYGVGLSALSLATLGLGLAGWMRRAVVLIGLMLAVALFGAAVCWNCSTRWIRGPGRRNAPVATPSSVRWPTVLGFATGGAAVFFFLVISLLGAMLPATSFDVREYHMQGPKEFYLAEQIEFLPHNVYTNMPFGTGMLSLLGMIVAGDWWWGALVGQTVLATFSTMTALGIYALGRRFFSPAAGWVGTLIYLTTPWVYRISIIPYTENALCFFLLAAVLAAVLAVRSCRMRYWLIAGLLAGSAAGCKYPGLVSTVVPLGIASLSWPVVLRLCRSAARPGERSSWVLPPDTPPRVLAVRSAMVFSLGALLTCGPWLAKNWVLTGNPAYPLLYQVFGGWNWTPEKNERWEWAHRVPLMVALGLQRPPDGKPVDPNDSQHGITPRLLLYNLTDVAVRADWLSPLLFGLAPLALLRRSGRLAAAWLWLLVAYLFFQWWLLTHRIDRFWVPLIPVVAILAGAGTLWSQARLWRYFATVVIGLVVFFNFSYVTTPLCGYNDYTVSLSTGRDPTNDYDNLINFLNRWLPPSARVLAVGAADFFHLDRPVVYNTVFDDSIFEQLVRGRAPREVAAVLDQRGITYVFVSWAEVARYRNTYGFSEFVTPTVFRDLVRAGVLGRVWQSSRRVNLKEGKMAAGELYEVIPESSR